jgi:outer membrane protein assembly factor BamD (BamD/ComL family)
MSPEQARGEELDVRTDLFSFGLVLYEMATGQQTFQGSTSAVVFDAILNREPPAPVQLNANVPLSLERLIARAIEKDRDRRFASANDMRVALEEVRRERDSGSSMRAAVAGASKAPSGSSWPSAAVSVAMAAKPQAVPAATAAAATAAKPAPRSSALRLLAFVAGAAVVLAAVYVGFQAGSPVLPAAPAADVAAVPAPIAPPSAADAVAAAPATAPASPVEYAVATTPAPPPTPAPTPVAKPAPKPAASAAAPAAAAPALEDARKGDDPAAALFKTAQAKVDAQLLDQALEDLKRTVASYASSAAAPAAQLLIGQIYERQNRPDDAQAAYVELRSHYGNTAAAADATYQLAELVAKGKRADRDAAARALYGEVFERFPKSAKAPLALNRKAALEDKVKLRLVDSELQASVPASLVTYRSLVRTYPSSPVAEPAYEALSERYKDVRQFTLAAEALEQLASHFPANRREAAWRAGEIYEDRVKDQARARAAYAQVPSTSSRYRDAQKKLR